MPSTCLQTVDVSYLNAPFPVQSLELCPVAEPGFAGIKTDDGSTIMWYSDKTVKWQKDGTVFTWWSKPTIKDAFTDHCTGNYYQFNSDTSVFCRYNGAAYYWSKPVDTSYTIGKVLNIHTCREAGGEYFLDGEECCCYQCIECGSRMEQDVKYCSKFCSWSSHT